MYQEATKVALDTSMLITGEGVRICREEEHRNTSRTIHPKTSWNARGKVRYLTFDGRNGLYNTGKRTPHQYPRVALSCTGLVLVSQLSNLSGVPGNSGRRLDEQVNVRERQHSGFCHLVRKADAKYLLFVLLCFSLLTRVNDHVTFATFHE